MNVDKKTWIAWRIRLGAGRKEALKLWLKFEEWQAQESLQPRARVLKVAPWQNWEREYRAFLDEMPRKPYAFLAMVAANEKRRATLAQVVERKAKGRKKYERAYTRGAGSG